MRGLKALVSRRLRPAALTVSYRCDSFAERWWRSSVSFSHPRRGFCSRHESHLLTALILLRYFGKFSAWCAISAFFFTRRRSEEKTHDRRDENGFIDPLRTNTAEKRWEWREVLTAEIYFTHSESRNLVSESSFAGFGRTCLTLSLEMRHKRKAHTTRPTIASPDQQRSNIFKVSRQKTSTLMHAEAPQLRHPSTWRHFARTAATSHKRENDDFKSVMMKREQFLLI